MSTTRHIPAPSLGDRYDPNYESGKRLVADRGPLNALASIVDELAE